MDLYQILENLKRVEDSNMPVAVDSTSPVGGNPQTEGKDVKYTIKLHDRKGELKAIEYRGSDYSDEVVASDCRSKATMGWRVECTKDNQPFDWKSVAQKESIDDDDGGYVDLPDAHASTGSFNRGGYNKLTLQSYYDKLDYLHKQLSDPRQQANYPELRARLMDLIKAAKISGLPVKESKFAFANPKQKPGDQVRGTERATKKKSGAHPFAGRLVGATEAKATKTRLDPKCWKGKKIGNPKTKVKGGVRVNNCVPVEEEWETYINEFGADNPGQQNQTAQDQAKEIATTQQSLNKLKSAGANITNVQQAARTVLKPQDKPMDPTDMKQLSGWGKDMEQMIDSDDPAIINQLAALMQKAKKG